jgi:hypothetical protein
MMNARSMNWESGDCRFAIGDFRLPIDNHKATNREFGRGASANFEFVAGIWQIGNRQSAIAIGNLKCLKSAIRNPQSPIPPGSS